MKSLRALILICVSLFCATSAFAQDNAKLDSLKREYDKLLSECGSLQGKVNTYVREKGDLQRQLQAKEAELKEREAGWGAAAADLGITIADKNAEIADLTNKLNSMKETADKTMARFCYIRLSQRYKKDWIDEALTLWKSITTPAVLNEYKNTDVLLRKYKQYYEEVRKVLVDAQALEAQRKDSVGISKFKENTIKALKGTSYYKEWYGKDTRISYLDRVIDQAISHLENTAPGQYDFTYLIEFLLPEIPQETQH